MDSILLLNKPEGVSSAGVLNRIKKQFNISSLGHAGTLDPFATGLLIVGKGRATKLLPYFQSLPKEYLATVKLGIQTDTDDITGKIMEQKESKVTLSKLENILPSFIGNIKQLPPRYSALKINGERAYKLAREDKEFEVKEREVYIDNIQLISFSEDEQSFTIQVNCSTGTYIRSLARDLGLKLSSLGTLSTLERSAIGHYKIKDSTKPDNLKEESFISIPEILKHLPALTLKDEFYKVVHNGAIIMPQFLKSGTGNEGYSPSYYLLWSERQEFLGVVDNRNSRFFYKAL